MNVIRAPLMPRTAPWTEPPVRVIGALSLTRLPTSYRLPFARESVAKLMPIGWLVFGSAPKSFRVVVPQFLEFHHDLIQFIGYAWGTQGYLLTRAGAQQFVHHLQVVRRNVDSSMDRAWHHGIANLAIFPFPLFELMGPSSIESSRFEAREIPLSWRLKRFPYQVLERAKRKFGNRNVGPTISAAARREPRDYGREGQQRKTGPNLPIRR